MAALNGKLDVHGLSHPGSKSSQRLVLAKFIWHSIKKDIRAWTDSCIDCQCDNCHTKAPLAQFYVPKRRFDHINIDLVGPLPPLCPGFAHLLKVDQTTQWPEAVPLSTTRGTSELWNAVVGSLGDKLHRTTTYHPQASCVSISIIP